ncbi:MAG: stress responsive alpha-beta barrel domain-containing protein [Linnemannia gamsii]|nr:MAG: stress responsive alpha-beta barrel domain-containing protein [Linnemannia gamsii]
MTIAHIILIKVKPTVSETQAHDILKAVADLKIQLPTVVESVHLGVNFAARAKGFTHGFTMLFKDKAALETYDKSPEHIRVVTEVIRPNIEDIIAFDYEIEDYSIPRL